MKRLYERTLLAYERQQQGVTVPLDASAKQRAKRAPRPAADGANGAADGAATSADNAADGAADGAQPAAAAAKRRKRKRAVKEEGTQAAAAAGVEGEQAEAVDGAGNGKHRKHIKRQPQSVAPAEAGGQLAAEALQQQLQQHEQRQAAEPPPSWAGYDSPLALPVYETFSEEDYSAIWHRYAYQAPDLQPWFLKDFGKPNATGARAAALPASLLCKPAGEGAAPGERGRQGRTAALLHGQLAAPGCTCFAVGATSARALLGPGPAPAAKGRARRAVYLPQASGVWWRRGDDGALSVVVKATFDSFAVLEAGAPAAIWTEIRRGGEGVAGAAAPRGGHRGGSQPAVPASWQVRQRGLVCGPGTALGGGVHPLCPCSATSRACAAAGCQPGPATRCSSM